MKIGDMVKVTLAGREWTVEIENILSDGRVIIDVFGLKTIEKKDYKLV